jgi:long-chain acyl-CoA synthetase
MRIEAFLRRSAAADPDRIAIVAGDARIAYGTLDRMSDALGYALCARGVGRGDRVVVFMENVWEAAVAIFAVLKAGAVFCPVNPAVKADGLRYVIGNCRPKAILTQAKHAALCAEAGKALSSPPLVIAAGGKAAPGVLAFEDCIAEGWGFLPGEGDDGDLAMIIYTSGSTGVPKGVMMAHANMDAASGSIAAYLENTAEDVVLCVLPLAFTYGLYQLLVAVRVGATLVLEKSFAFPYAVLEKAHAESVTGLPLVPTMAAMILSMRETVPLPSLRYITNAAAALPPAHIEGLAKHFPGVRLYSMYGLTECARATYLSPEELAQRPDSVGKAIPGTRAFVVDGAGEPVGPGIVGELVVAGPHVMRGYWENAEATAAALRPGGKPEEIRLHTGDLFRVDEEGFLYFVGRKDDIIKIRGEKVAPRQVETVLHACPGVAEAVVIGRPDPILGTVLHAVVVASDPALTDREVIRHCVRALPDIMVPKTVEFRKELPKSANGKVMRRLVAEAGE